MNNKINNKTHFIRTIHVRGNKPKESPVGITDSPEDEDVAVHDDKKWNEEHKDKEEHCVCAYRRTEGHVVP